MSKLQVVDSESIMYWQPNILELQVFLERIAKLSDYCKQRLQSMSLSQISELKLVQEMKQEESPLFELLDRVVSAWYKMSASKQNAYREKDLRGTTTLHIKLQQRMFDIFLGQDNELLNQYAWFVAEYFAHHEEESHEHNMLAATCEFRQSIKAKTQEKPAVAINVVDGLLDKTAAFVTYLYGPSFKKFFIAYANMRPELNKAQAARHAICFWSQLPPDIKANFNDENDLTSAPVAMANDKLSWCDGGLHIGIKSISYCPDDYCHKTSNIIGMGNAILPTSEKCQFSFKDFFQIKSACVRFLADELFN